jgi:hypothetical protein
VTTSTDTTPDGTEQPKRRRRWWIIGGLLVLVPVVPIVIALVISSSTVKADTTSLSSYLPLGPPQINLPKPSFKPLAPGSGTLVALIRHPTDMRSRPGGHVIGRVSRKTSFGSLQALWVVRQSGDWVGVISPQAGNGHVGWIRTSAAVYVRVNWAIHVSLHRHQVMVLEDGKVREKYTVAIGRPSAPTPTGRFSVTDRLNTGDPSGPYGCCILALSAHSPHAIQGWGGGNRIAIHSTPETSSIGLPVSHGCLRLTIPEGRWLLQHIPLGTPTIIGE